jgi:hypothetical protein
MSSSTSTGLATPLAVKERIPQTRTAARHYDGYSIARRVSNPSFSSFCKKGHWRWAAHVKEKPDTMVDEIEANQVLHHAVLNLVATLTIMVK